MIDKTWCVLQIFISYFLYMKTLALIDKMMYQKYSFKQIIFKYKFCIKIKSHIAGIWDMLLLIREMRKIQSMTLTILSFFDPSVAIKRNVCMAMKIYVL